MAAELHEATPQNTLLRLVAGLAGATLLSSTLTHTPPAYGAAAKVLPFNDLTRLKYGLREIEYLVNNWDEKTTYCNFGEFQRELLTVENKQKLMKAAAETGLLDYDKSATMNVLCRKDPEVVRGFLGLTADNTLLNQADALMKSQAAIERVDADSLDEYIDTVETFTRAISAADTLSYEARTDYASQHTDAKEVVMQDAQNPINGNKNYLAQTKDSVVVMRDSLRTIVRLLNIQ